MSSSRHLLAAAGAVVLAAGLSACANPVEKLAENAVEKAIENEAGVDIDNDGDTLTITSEDGQLQAGENVDLPESWPGELPVPPARLVWAQTIENAWSLQYEDAESSHYEDVLAALEGWTELSTFEQPDFVMKSFENDAYTYMITYSEASPDSGSLIQITASIKTS